jgi:hypothetical protein
MQISFGEQLYLQTSPSPTLLCPPAFSQLFPPPAFLRGEKKSFPVLAAGRELGDQQIKDYAMADHS